MSCVSRFKKKVVYFVISLLKTNTIFTTSVLESHFVWSVVGVWHGFILFTVEMYLYCTVLSQSLCLERYICPVVEVPDVWERCEWNKDDCTLKKGSTSKDSYTMLQQNEAKIRCEHISPKSSFRFSMLFLSMLPPPPPPMLQNFLKRWQYLEKWSII